MKAIASAVTLVAALSLTARADFTIVQKVEGKEKEDGKRSATEITMKIRGDKIRVEVAPQTTLIIDGKTGDTITLINTKKRFLRLSGDKTKAIAELATKYGGNPAEKTKLTATGKKMTLNGYEADEYVAETKLFKASYWIAPSLPDSAAIMQQLQAVIPSAWNELAKGLMDYRDLPGFPLLTRVTTGDEEITSTVTSIKRDPLSDAEFSVPKDFEEMKMPNIQISGDNPEPTASAKP